jgi:hypothetical protein
MRLPREYHPSFQRGSQRNIYKLSGITGKQLPRNNYQEINPSVR